MSESSGHKPDLTETSPMDSRARAEAEREVQNGLPRTRSKGGTNVDTILGKIIVDIGLATSEEVQQCIEASRLSAQDSNLRTLGDLLVKNDYITKRQLERLRERVEAERSGQQIPGYKILGKLGAGAMATVFRAKQL